MIRSSGAGQKFNPITSATAASLIRSTNLPTNPASRPARAGWSFVKPSVVPGFGLTLGYTLTYLSLIVLIPIAALFVKSLTLPPERILQIATARRTLSALSVSFGSAFIAALVNLVFGLIVAWVLVRYKFPG